jgi:hypothetical protein
MGIDRSCYLGPYVECITKVVDITEDRCKVPQSCPNPISGFCSECGIKATERYSITDKEDPKVHYFDLFEDDMASTATRTPPKIEYTDEERIRRYRYIPNIRKPDAPNRKMYLSDAEIVQDLRNVDMQAEITWFRLQFTDQIEKLHQAYGNVDVCWGLIVWYS